MFRLAACLVGSMTDLSWPCYVPLWFRLGHWLLLSTIGRLTACYVLMGLSAKYLVCFHNPSGLHKNNVKIEIEISKNVSDSYLDYTDKN